MNQRDDGQDEKAESDSPAKKGSSLFDLHKDLWRVRNPPPWAVSRFW